MFLETNGNSQNLWDAEKAILIGKLLAINTYIKKQKRFQINILTLCFKKSRKKNNKLSPKLVEENKQ